MFGIRFFVLAFIAFLNQWLQHITFSCPWSRNYLDDLLVVPLVLSATQFFAELLNNHIDKYQLLLWTILSSLTFSVLFEFILSENQDFTSDPYDVLAYFGGGILYWLYSTLRSETPKPNKAKS